MIDLRPLIHPSFWFDIHPLALTAGSLRILFVIFALLLVLGAVIRMVSSHRKEDRHVTEVFNRIGRMSIVMGILGLLLFFFSFEEVPFFGARFWYLFWGIGLIVWISSIVHYVKKTVPAEREAERVATERRKYLPDGIR